MSVKHRLSAILLTCLLSACAAGGAVPAERFSRDVGTIDYSGVKFTPWDVRAASANVTTRNIGDYTLMIYMNGSDLESESGAATDDINELLSAGIDTANVIIFTGGTNRWQNDVISEKECALWRVEKGELEKIAGVGLLNMGDAGTLSGFIEFTLENFPARKTGLIMWDHGGGSIAGYGHDENFDNGTLGLLEIDYAFEQAGLSGNKLEFLGFDACLMSTVEVAVVASRYARYLVASQDLEPGDGWDYTCFSALNADTSLSGAELGRIIINAFADNYGMFAFEPVTLAVTDLSEAGNVMGAMEALARRCSGQLPSSFQSFVQRRSMTKAFGGGSPRDNGCDMVDAGDMARKLSSMFPSESAAVLAALDDAVIYSRHNSNVKLSGLSAYYTFDGDDAQNALDIYASLGMGQAYTDYLHGFSRRLGGYTEQSPTQRVTVFGVENLRAYEAYHSQNGAGYAIPIELNGADADVMLFRSADGEWTLLGVRREDGYIIQKGVEELEDDDEITFKEA